MQTAISFVAACLLLLSAMLAAQTKTITTCHEAVATPCRVSGKLISRHVCGPPWFCEKKGDEPRFTIYVIQLHMPIHIACIRDHVSDEVKDCGTTKTIQIYPLDALASEEALKAMLGSEVVATGTTHEPVAPMDQTPGIMDMASIRSSHNNAPH